MGLLCVEKFLSIPFDLMESNKKEQLTPEQIAAAREAKKLAAAEAKAAKIAKATGLNYIG